MRLIKLARMRQPKTEQEWLGHVTVPPVPIPPKESVSAKKPVFRIPETIGELHPKEQQVLKDYGKVRQGKFTYILGEKGQEIRRLPSFTERLRGKYPKALLLGGAALIGGGGLMFGKQLISKIKENITYNRDFANMMKFAPEIKQYDKGQVEARFRTLRTFNPAMSADPLIASSWVKQTMDFPVVTPAQVLPAIEGASKMDSRRSEGGDLRRAFQTATTLLGGDIT